jgi:peptidyl-prolyl cis-trans isomerase B (cyclophilin B)
VQRSRFRLGIVLATALLALLLSGAPMADTNPQVAIETNHGRIVLELNAEAAPETVANFMSYVDDGFYDGTIFHRVIPGFMVQGGGFDKNMSQKSAGEPIRNEADNGLKNEVGAISMARTQDPHSATAQFFINVNDNDFLNHTAPNAQGWGYAVFGKVTEGMDVVRQIESVPTGRSGMHQDVPQEPVVMESVKRVED